MTFQPRPLASGDTLLASRDQIRTNFEIIETVSNINHVAIGDANQGKHAFLQMPEQAAKPTIVANEAAFYTKLASNTNFFAESEGGAEYQLTTMTAATDAVINRFGTKANDPTAGQDGGFTFLPGGMLMCYGRADQATVAGTVTFPLAFTGVPYSVTATPESAGNTSDFHITAITNTQFTYGFQGTVPTAIQYVAVGTI